MSGGWLPAAASGGPAGEGGLVLCCRPAVCPVPALPHPTLAPAARGQDFGQAGQAPASCPHKQASVGLPGAREGAEMWNSRFLSGPDAGRQPRAALRTSDQVLGADWQTGTRLSQSGTASDPPGQAICGHSFSFNFSARLLPVGPFPKDLVP